MDDIEIYYFSGTGNSLHAAKELAKNLPNAKLIPIAGFLDEKTFMPQGSTVGFAFPVHMTAIPVVVRDFIGKLDLQKTRYIFAIVTRIGTQHSAFSEIDKILHKKNKNLDAAFSLNMPSNDPKFNYKALAPDETAKLESAMRENIKKIAMVILNKEKSRDKDTSYISRVPFLRLISLLAILTDGIQHNFYANEKCTGCGTCEKVCLSKKIKMSGGKPIWQKDVKCFKCYACLNYCPNQAVQIKGQTEKNGRYSHPYAAASEIAAQKEKVIF